MLSAPSIQPDDLSGLGEVDLSTTQALPVAEQVRTETGEIFLPADTVAESDSLVEFQEMPKELSQIACEAKELIRTAKLEKGGRSGNGCSAATRGSAISLVKETQIAISGKNEKSLSAESVSAIVDMVAEIVPVRIQKNQSLVSICSMVMKAEELRQVAQLSEFLDEAREIQIEFVRDEIYSLFEHKAVFSELFVKAQTFVRKLAAQLRSLRADSINEQNASQIVSILESLTGARISNMSFAQYIYHLDSNFRTASVRKRAAALLDLPKGNEVKSAPTK